MLSWPRAARFARLRDESTGFRGRVSKGAGMAESPRRGLNRLDARVRKNAARENQIGKAKVHRVRNAHFSEKVPRLYLDDCSAELSFCLFAIGGARASPAETHRRTRTFHEITSTASLAIHARACPRRAANRSQPHRDTRVVQRLPTAAPPLAGGAQPSAAIPSPPRYAIRAP